MRDVWKEKTRSFASKETENEKIEREIFFENMIYREAALKSAAFFVYKWFQYFTAYIIFYFPIFINRIIFILFYCFPIHNIASFPKYHVFINLIIYNT